MQTHKPSGTALQVCGQCGGCHSRGHGRVVRDSSVRTGQWYMERGKLREAAKNMRRVAIHPIPQRYICGSSVFIAREGASHAPTHPCCFSHDDGRSPVACSSPALACLQSSTCQSSSTTTEKKKAYNTTCLVLILPYRRSVALHFFGQTLCCHCFESVR